jgi:GGDEF domain-containing protein
VVVLSGCGPELADLKRIELQQLLEELHFEASPGHLVELGGSVGMASFPGDGDTYEALLAVADRRMYEDKARRKLAPVAAGAAADATGGAAGFAKIDRPASAQRIF